MADDGKEKRKDNAAYTQKLQFESPSPAFLQAVVDLYACYQEATAKGSGLLDEEGRILDKAAFGAKFDLKYNFERMTQIFHAALIPTPRAKNAKNYKEPADAKDDADNDPDEADAKIETLEDKIKDFLSKHDAEMKKKKKKMDVRSLRRQPPTTEASKDKKADKKDKAADTRALADWFGAATDIPLDASQMADAFLSSNLSSAVTGSLPGILTMLCGGSMYNWVTGFVTVVSVVPTVFLRGPSKATRELLAPVFSRYFNTFLIQIVSSFAPMPIKAPLVAVFSLIQSAYEATVCAARFGLIDKFPSMFEIVLNMDWTSMLVVLVVLLILAFYSMGKNTVKNLLRMVGFSMPANGIEDGDGDDDDETRKEWAVFGPNVKKRWYFKYARLFARDFIDKTLRQTPTTTLLVGVADVLRSAVGGDGTLLLKGTAGVAIASDMFWLEPIRKGGLQAIPTPDAYAAKVLAPHYATFVKNIKRMNTEVITVIPRLRQF